MNIILGTAQFGLDYGVTNTSGKLNFDTIRKILGCAEKNNILTVDTAQAYGDCEKIIGKFPNFRVMSKISLSTSSDKISCEEEILKKFEASLHDLARASIYCLMLHNAEDLSDQQLSDAISVLQKLKDEGLIKKIGVSIYNPQKLRAILSICSLDLVQAPMNVLDQRFCAKEIITLIEDSKIDFFARSIFLQGSLLVDEVPKELHFGAHFFNNFREFCKLRNMNAIQGCLSFIQNFDFVAGVVVGATSHRELEKIVKYSKEQYGSTNYNELECSDDRLINPSLWKS